jgi:hypothetical protein
VSVVKVDEFGDYGDDDDEASDEEEVFRGATGQALIAFRDLDLSDSGDSDSDYVDEPEEDVEWKDEKFVFEHAYIA